MEQCVPKGELIVRILIKISWVNLAMDKIRLTLVLLLLFSTLLSTYTIMYYQTDNSNLRKQLKGLQEEITVLKTANLTSAFGIIEVPARPDQILGSINSHLWVTGWIFNSGGSIARNVALNVLAFNQSNDVIMNVTVPIASGSEFATATEDYLVPKVPYYVPGSISLGELKYGTVLSQQNMTIKFSLYHAGSFPDTTRYEINPLWEKFQ